MEPITYTFVNGYNAFRFADFCAFSGIKCKLGKSAGVWSVVF